MSGAGSALMGTGSSRGDDRAVAAAEMAISSPLLEASIDGAHGVLLSIQGGSDLGLFEINEAAQLVANSAAVDANIIFGAVIDDALGDEVRVTVIAAGLDETRSGRAGGSSGRAGSGGTAFGGNGSGGTASGVPGGSAGTAGGTQARTGGATPRPGRAEPPPHYDQDQAGRLDDEASEWDVETEMLAYGSQDSSDVVAVSGLAVMLTAPVMPAAENGATKPAGRQIPVLGLADHEAGPDEDEAMLYDAPEHLSDAVYSPAPRPPRAEGKTFDVPASRRRPVVFEEDDDLDVPDFLK